MNQKLDKKSFMRHLAMGVAALGALTSLACAGAAGDEEPVGQTNNPLQLTFVGLSESATGVGVNIEMAQTMSSIKGRSVGAIRTKKNQTTGIQSTCGATFISPHYAVTAAHCVPKSDIPLNQQGYFTVEQIDMRNVSSAEVTSQAAVTGTWPNYQRTSPLTAAQGYVVDTYQCQVVSRCTSDATYGRDQCPLPSVSDPDVQVPNTTMKYSDIAMVYCPNRPTTRNGGQNWVPITPSQLGTGNVETWWFHEIVNMQYRGDVGPYTPTANWAHYGYWDEEIGDTSNNYHYRTPGTTGHQVFPLRSWRSSTNVLYSALGDSTGTERTRYHAARRTNIPICHGTSGSGLFQSGVDAIMGVMVYGGPSLFNNNYLCDMMNQFTPSEARSYYVPHYDIDRFVNPPAGHALTGLVLNDR